MDRVELLRRGLRALNAEQTWEALRCAVSSAVVCSDGTGEVEIVRQVGGTIRPQRYRFDLDGNPRTRNVPKSVAFYIRKALQPAYTSRCVEVTTLA